MMKPINDEELKFLQKISATLGFVQKYKDAALLKEALELIPEEELQVKATQKLSILEEDQSIGLEDLVLMELLHWFKDSFFSWVDAPNCDVCGCATVKSGLVDPLDEEAIWEVAHVEVFCCQHCQRIVRFPRYNHPRKLLQTRRGRCGEWANCFTLLCHALGYDARLVRDWTDHVWTEVLSRDRNEWLHCDPCEDAFDTPFMYELGWKKQLTYIIAFSPFDIQDVTWRYTTDYSSVCQRRTLVREEYLEHLVWSHAQKLQESMTPDELQRHEERTLSELVSFLTPTLPDNQAIHEGRSSGSLAWRLARGEILPNTIGGYTFKLLPEEIREKHFLVKYSCALDKYTRKSGGYSVESEGWSSWVNVQKNIFRKSESDWKMVYLVRTEGSDKGSLCWKFDFDDSGLMVDKVKLSLNSQTFETGKVAWEVCPTSEEDKPISVQADGTIPITIEALKGHVGFLLRATLSQGSGEVAWQHAQLFRQSMDSDTFPFQIEVFFTENTNTGTNTKNS